MRLEKEKSVAVVSAEECSKSENITEIKWVLPSIPGKVSFDGHETTTVRLNQVLVTAYSRDDVSSGDRRGYATR